MSGLCGWLNDGHLSKRRRRIVHRLRGWEGLVRLDNRVLNLCRWEVVQCIRPDLHGLCRGDVLNGRRHHCIRARCDQQVFDLCCWYVVQRLGRDLHQLYCWNLPR